jgi:hypothetical protein
MSSTLRRPSNRPGCLASCPTSRPGSEASRASA